MVNGSTAGRAQHPRRSARAKSRTHLRRQAGVSLGPTELCASFMTAGRSAIRRIPLEPAPSDAGSWPSLVRAFAELRASIGGAPIGIALLPPLAEVRVVELPPMRDDEAERALARAAGKFFVSARQPQLVGVAPRPKRSRAGTVRVAAAAPARLVAAILAAARDAQIVVATMEPAASAWAAAAAAVWPAFARGRANVVVAQSASCDLLRAADGRLDGIRRFRAGPVDADLIADAVRSDVRPEGSMRVAVLGARPERDELARALSERGLVVTSPEDGDDGEAAEDAAAAPELLAAHFVGAGGGPRFRTDDARAMRRREAWRATLAVTGAAAALLIAGAALELWGVHRQLALARAERARLAPQLSATLVGRSSVETVYRHLSTLADAERTAPPLSRTIASLSDALPDGAYLTALRTRGDSLVLDGLAEQATDAFNAVEKVPGLANVRSAAPVRRQLQDDSTALERFTIAARMLPP